MPLNFATFQSSKEILIWNQELSCFEDEKEQKFFLDDDHCLRYIDQEIYCLSDCQWLLIYPVGVYIEKINDGPFLLTIENHQWKDPNLTKLEKILYRWLQDE